MENNMDIIAFFRDIKESEWDIPITKKRRVKDVLSHLVGWEREVAQELPKVFETDNEPWFILTDDYDNFNERIFQEFKNYSSKALISELEKWQGALEKEIRTIGEERIRQRPHMDWVFNEGDKPHFEHHIKQVKKALKY